MRGPSHKAPTGPAWHGEPSDCADLLRQDWAEPHLCFPVCDGRPSRRGGGGWLRRRLVGAVGVLRPLELHLESLHADLEAVHGLDGGLGAARVVEADEACRREAEREATATRFRRRNGRHSVGGGGVTDGCGMSLMRQSFGMRVMILPHSQNEESSQGTKDYSHQKRH